MKHAHRVQFIVQLQTLGTLQDCILSHWLMGEYKQFVFNKERYHAPPINIFDLPFVSLTTTPKIERVWKKQNQYVMHKQVNCGKSCAYNGKRSNASKSRAKMSQN